MKKTFITAGILLVFNFITSAQIEIKELHIKAIITTKEKGNRIIANDDKSGSQFQFYAKPNVIQKVKIGDTIYKQYNVKLKKLEYYLQVKDEQLKEQKEFIEIKYN